MKRSLVKTAARFAATLIVTASVAAAAVAQGNPRATGGFTFISPFAGETKVSFNAIAHTDGSASGHVRTSDANGVVEWRVTHLTIVGNRAFIGFFNPDDPFVQYVFVVEDNGEGAGAPAPDRALGTLYFIGFPIPAVTNASIITFLGSFFANLGAPIVNGNIQVRG